MSRFKATDRSGTIATDAIAQVFLPANPARNGAWIQNTSMYDLWVNELAPAAPASPSLRISPGQLYEFPESVTPTEVSIFGVHAGQSWSAREW